MDALLAVDHLRVAFGGVVALDDVSFTVGAREIVGLIGPNGAGKTTVFNCITRVVTPERGSVRWQGADLVRTGHGPSRWWPGRARGGAGVPAHGVLARGIARTYQTPALFPTLSVLENLLVGQHSALRYGPLAGACGWPSARAAERAGRARARELLAMLGLAHRAEQRAGALPFAEQKRVELARALCLRPRLLLLDEPAAGLTHDEVQDLARWIVRLRDEFAASVLLVEHHMGLVMQVCERVVVLDYGRVLAEGAPQTVAALPEVVEAYLGARP